jgi:4-amino-4-deoxy-L-arabinose transferase-like glycosyltransferase
MDLVKDKSDFKKLYEDELALFCFITIYLMAWILLAAFLLQSTELDNIEQVVWSQYWQWGYYKHPPLPSALLHCLNLLFNGPSIAIIAFAAQSCSVVALIYIWLLAKQILSRKRAIIAVLITSLIAYHNYRALTFNHNTVSLPFIGASLYYFHSALQDRKNITHWFLLGIACGLAMLTKYSAVLVIASFFVYITWERLWTDHYIIRGSLISTLVFLLVFYPNILWLYQNNWLSLFYLHEKLVQQGSRLNIILTFFTNQLIRVGPMLPLLFRIWYLIKKDIIKREKIYSARSSVVVNDHSFLLIVFIVPLFFALLPSLLTGSVLDSNWVSAFMLPVGIILTHFFLKRYNEAQLLNTTYCWSWVTHTLILTCFFIVGLIYPTYAGNAARLNFPSQVLVDKIVKIWSEHRNEPLAIVVSDPWVAGNILLHTYHKPMVLLDDDFGISPWIKAQDVSACGAFVISDLTNIELEETLQAYFKLIHEASIKGEFDLEWGRAPRGKKIHYTWAIRPPLHGNNEGCRYPVS